MKTDSIKEMRNVSLSREFSMDGNWNPPLRYAMMIALIAVLVLVIWYIRSAIGPLVIAALLAYLLNPVKNVLTEHTRLSSSFATTLVLLAVLSLLAAVPAFMLPSLVRDYQVLILDLEDSILRIQDLLATPVVIMEWEFNLGRLFPDPMLWLAESAQGIPENIFYLLEVITENLLWLLVIFIATYYLIRDWSRLRNWVLHLPPEPYQPDVHRIYQEIKQVWRGYLRGNLALMIIVGVVFSIAWLAVGVPGALILGIIAGVLTIIPDLGPAIAVGLAVIVALFEGSTYLPLSNIWFAVLVAGLYFGLINIMNIWLRPRIFGRSVHMHDGIVFVAIIIAVVIWGILGALVIIPVLASASIVIRYIYNRSLGLPAWSEDLPLDESENVQSGVD
jgi:predicted PurR-regulated permease PerM